MGTAKDSQRTQAAMIQAAGELFAESGRHGVTVRDIIARAGVSLSALHYHFGDKDGLYREVLLEACRTDQPWDTLGQHIAGLTAYQALCFVIRMSIEDYHADAVDWRLRLIERELLNPSAAFREVVRRRLKPDLDQICDVVGAAAGRPASDPAVRFGAMSMYILASSFATRREVLQELAPEVVDAVDQRERWLDVLAQLTLDAVERFGVRETTAPRGGAARS